MTAPYPERTTGARVLAETLADLEQLRHRYPAFDRARFPAVALTTAAHLPDASRDARQLAALVSVWIIAFDDLVDGGEFDERALSLLANELKDTAGRAAGPIELDGKRPSSMPVEEQLHRSLQEISRRIESFCPAESLLGYWRKSFDGMVEAIIEQRALGLGHQGPSTLPAEGLWALLENSIGVPTYLATCFISSGDPDLPDRVGALERLARAAARAIRLANDLRTWEKDEREGNSNSLALLQPRTSQALRTDPSSVQSLLEMHLECEVERVRRLLRASPTRPCRAEQAVERLVTFVTAFYRRHDYHTYSADASEVARGGRSHLAADRAS